MEGGELLITRESWTGAQRLREFEPTMEGCVEGRWKEIVGYRRILRLFIEWLVKAHSR